MKVGCLIEIKNPATTYEADTAASFSQQAAGPAMLLPTFVEYAGLGISPQDRATGMSQPAPCGRPGEVTFFLN